MQRTECRAKEAQDTLAQAQDRHAQELADVQEACAKLNTKMVKYQSQAHNNARGRDRAQEGIP